MKAICLDALGTLVDISHVVDQLNNRFPGQGAEISNLWRIKQVDYSRLRTMAGQYKPFDQITRDALNAALSQVGVRASEQDIDEFMTNYMQGVAFHDAQEFLAANTIPWSIVTNANWKMIRQILNSVGISIDDSSLLTSDKVESFKVSSDLYNLGWQWAQGQGATTKEETVFVSANQWDAIAATWFGFTTCWVNRNQETHEYLDIRPTFEVSNLDSVTTVIETGA